MRGAGARGRLRHGRRGLQRGDRVLGRLVGALVQALQIAAQRLDFLIGQRLGDAAP